MRREWKQLTGPANARGVLVVGTPVTRLDFTRATCRKKTYPTRITMSVSHAGPCTRFHPLARKHCGVVSLPAVLASADPDQYLGSPTRLEVPVHGRCLFMVEAKPG